MSNVSWGGGGGGANVVIRMGIYLDFSGTFSNNKKT